MYGTQAMKKTIFIRSVFENDVKMYGTQARVVREAETHSLRMM